MYCIVVKNVVKEGSRDKYLAAMLPNAKASVDNEEGCLVFDVLEAKEEPNTFYLYEIYTSPDALQIHKQTDHYLKSRPLISDLVVDQSVLRADVVEMNPAAR
ncbi:putative quinol monooxygenase [Marinobacter fonticola]|uniref:putative quinol monooxygenase n=1 Tax=Marinobacter fonticola TaxID=2603215 RepID=UPI0011E7867D|nr:putative quinol monooxygenase [Marinobacter fonticola]